MNTWFKIANREDAVEVQILEEIGGWGISGEAFINEVKAACPDKDTKLRMVINSPGGSVIEGNFIYNELLKMPNRITAEISGMAASMASIIAMAADEIEIHENSYLMIHNPWTMAMGESDDLRKMADLLDGMKASAIKAYQRHCNCDEDKLIEMMDNETWIGGYDAVSMGFADRMLEPLDVAAKALTIPATVRLMVNLEALDMIEEDETEETHIEINDLEEENVSESTTDEQGEVLQAESDSDTAIEQEADPEADEEAQEAEEVDNTPALLVRDLQDALDSVQVDLEKQLEVAKHRQSENDKLRAELDKLKVDSADELNAAISENVELRERLSKLSAPGFEVSDSSPLTWHDAFKQLGYEEARIKYPELYEEFMENAQKNRK